MNQFQSYNEPSQQVMLHIVDLEAEFLELENRRDLAENMLI